MKKIYVGNLALSATEADLRAMFGAYGAVESAVLIMDRDSGRSRGFGFVEMADRDAEKAIHSLNGSEANGRALAVSEARPEPNRGSLRGSGREKYRDGGGRQW